MSLADRLDPDTWRAALWALRAKRHVHRELRARGVGFAPVPRPPEVPDRARRGVVAVLARSGASCLECAAVLQAWELAHARLRDVVVGVVKPTSGFRAHAWLDGDDSAHDDAYTELLRIPPRSPARS